MRPLPLAAHYEIDAERQVAVGLRREARVVSTNYDTDAWSERPQQSDDTQRGASLKCHDGKTHDIGRSFVH